MLQNAGFEDIQITVKENGRDIVKDWIPGSGAENYVTSAYVAVRAPGPRPATASSTARRRRAAPRRRRRRAAAAGAAGRRRARGARCGGLLPAGGSRSRPREARRGGSRAASPLAYAPPTATDHVTRLGSDSRALAARVCCWLVWRAGASPPIPCLMIFDAGGGRSTRA